MTTYENIRDIESDGVKDYIRLYNPPKTSMNIVYFKKGHRDIVTDERGVNHWETNGYKITEVFIHGYDPKLPSSTLFSLD